MSLPLKAFATQTSPVSLNPYVYFLRQIRLSTRTVSNAINNVRENRLPVPIDSTTRTPILTASIEIHKRTSTRKNHSTRTINHRVSKKTRIQSAEFRTRRKRTKPRTTRAPLAGNKHNSALEPLREPSKSTAFLIYPLRKRSPATRPGARPFSQLVPRPNRNREIFTRQFSFNGIISLFARHFCILLFLPSFARPASGSPPPGPAVPAVLKRAIERERERETLRVHRLPFHPPLALPTPTLWLHER